MEDLISRQAAIDAMEQAKEQYVDRRVIIGKMQDIVNNLPSTQPTIEAEPVRRGRWILEDIPYTGCYRITCSECGEDVTSTAPYFGGVTWDYCPWCGARMEEQE